MDQMNLKTEGKEEISASTEVGHQPDGIQILHGAGQIDGRSNAPVKNKSLEN